MEKISSVVLAGVMTSALAVSGILPFAFAASIAANLESLHIFTQRHPPALTAPAKIVSICENVLEMGYCSTNMRPSIPYLVQQICWQMN